MKYLDLMAVTSARSSAVRNMERANVVGEMAIDMGMLEAGFLSLDCKWNVYD